MSIGGTRIAISQVQHLAQNLLVTHDDVLKIGDFGWQKAQSRAGPFRSLFAIRLQLLCLSRVATVLRTTVFGRYLSLVSQGNEFRRGRVRNAAVASACPRCAATNVLRTTFCGTMDYLAPEMIQAGRAFCQSFARLALGRGVVHQNGTVRCGSSMR